MTRKFDLLKKRSFSGFVSWRIFQGLPDSLKNMAIQITSVNDEIK